MDNLQKTNQRSSFEDVREMERRGHLFRGEPVDEYGDYMHQDFNNNHGQITKEDSDTALRYFRSDYLRAKKTLIKAFPEATKAKFRPEKQNKLIEKLLKMNFRMEEDVGRIGIMCPNEDFTSIGITINEAYQQMGLHRRLIFKLIKFPTTYEDINTFENKIRNAVKDEEYEKARDLIEEKDAFVNKTLKIGYDKEGSLSFPQVRKGFRRI